MKVLSVILRVVIALAAAGMFMWFVIPMTHDIINPGNILGAAMCVWTVFLCSPLRKPVAAFCSSHLPLNVLWKTANIGFAVLLVYGAAVTACIFFFAAGKPAENSTVIVLGAHVRPTGEPSKILRGRITAAEKYLTEHPDAIAVLSGGKGADEPQSEADCMYRVMVADGISPERLYREDKSTDTAENFKFSERIIEENGLSSDIAITTDGFHQFRARLIAQRSGTFDEIGAVSAQTDPLYVPTYVVREWFALPLLLFK